jgi:hypothetical protein
MAGKLKAPKDGCTIRAYRHGLGDCFLLAFSNGRHEQFYVLIDCGVLLGTADAEETMTAVAKDIRAATDDQLDVVVMTHQHWDHISGFGQAAAELRQIEAKELWVSWAEDAEDPLAEELLERYGAALTSLRAAAPLLGASKSPQARRTEELMSFLGPLGPGERLTTDKIMKDMLERFSGRTRFCTPGDTPHKLRGLPGVSFFVLGPPKDVTFIRKSRPSHGDVYMADPRIGASASLMAAVQAGAPAGSGDAPRNPFSESYAAGYDDSGTPAAQARGQQLAECQALYERDAWRQIEDPWLDGFGELAIQLDSHLNNTSLALAIELEDERVLLFPADAQVGNWRSWHTVEWEGRPGVTAEDLLGRTVFYKVGHHASHNATLGEKGLEMMSSPELRAVIPLDREMAEKRRWAMPYDELYDRLKSKTRERTFVTCDDDSPAFITRKTDLYADFEFKPLGA